MKIDTKTVATELAAEFRAMSDEDLGDLPCHVSDAGFPIGVDAADLEEHGEFHACLGHQDGFFWWNMSATEAELRAMTDPDLIDCFAEEIQAGLEEELILI